MVELPTREELEQLYYEKGHDALVWYAWRCALRASPVLGCMSLHEIWPEQTVKQSYALLRPLCLLAQWPSAYASDAAAVAAAYAVAAATTAATATAVKAAAYAVRAAAATADAAISTAATTAAAAAYAAVTATAATAAAYAAARVAADVANARADWQYLRKTTLQDWLARPLWFEEIEKPLHFIEYEQQLLVNLKQLGLDFLANDLQSLWQGKPLASHAPNYFKRLSESILNDPEALRRAILYGEATNHVQAVRVLLLGSGGAGKTSLAQVLKGEKPIEKKHQAATLGVDYQQHQPIQLHKTLANLKLAANGLDLYLWDFGGQTIFHGLHRAFLHENCVYVLVVDNRHEQAPDEWLHQIRHLAGRHAQVLLVTNEYEHCHARQNETRLLREFGDLLNERSFFYFSCLEPDLQATQPTAFRAFVEQLIQASLDSRRSIFATTLRVQEQLHQQYEQQPFLHDANVIKLIEEITPESESTLRQLIQLGFLVPVKKGGLQYCLKPAWAVDHAYRLLHGKKLREQQGLADVRVLAAELADSVEPEQMGYLSDFLHDRELCCLLTNEQYFFPDAAASNEPSQVRELLKRQPRVTLYFDLPYLPLGFHARLVHKLFNKGSDTGIHKVDAIWRHGFIVDNPQASALVQYHLRKASVEMILIGKASVFVKLFQTFYPAFKAAVISESGIQEKNIHLSVVFHGKPFAIHSSADFISALKSIHTIEDLTKEVAKMAAKETNYYAGDHIENMGGAGSNFAIKSEHFSQSSHVQYAEINQDQRQQLALLVNELFKHAAQLEGEKLVALGATKSALEKPDAPQSKALLSKVWSGVKDLGVFTKDTLIPIAEKVAEHKEAIIGIVAASAAAVKPIP